MANQTTTLDTLHQLFEDTKASDPYCKNFYCTTCGGLFAQFEEALREINSSDLCAALTDPTEFKFTKRDFNYLPNRMPYALVLNVSPKVEFFMLCFKQLRPSQQATLITSWLEDCEHWPLWLFDGMSYYFVSDVNYASRKQWQIKLKALIDKTNDASLKETERLKFKQ
jgi:hypothetical protein